MQISDADVRQRRCERDAIRRADLDLDFVQRFAKAITQLYPGIPSSREMSIAEHACRKYTGRIGRTAAAKELAKEAINLAVIAHIRHVETEYDDLILSGFDRISARTKVDDQIQEIFEQWKQV
ncbi:MAG TPA: DUF2293 domain-containing protein [Desulfohalobiaceae bacterium]|nr:DUF2293 domain-containing protein [Desulfohalobiaceae bacterium]